MTAPTPTRAEVERQRAIARESWFAGVRAANDHQVPADSKEAIMARIARLDREVLEHLDRVFPLPPPPEPETVIEGPSSESYGFALPHVNGRFRIAHCNLKADPVLDLTPFYPLSDRATVADAVLGPEGMKGAAAAAYSEYLAVANAGDTALSFIDWLPDRLAPARLREIVQRRLDQQEQR